MHAKLLLKRQIQDGSLNSRPNDLHVFSFRAEDGIRDLTVTGVQTCALPISRRPGALRRSRPRSVHPRSGPLPPSRPGRPPPSALRAPPASLATFPTTPDRPSSSAPAKRSEERRVGKECSTRTQPEDENRIHN